jgi:hypothetical protein
VQPANDSFGARIPLDGAGASEFCIRRSTSPRCCNRLLQLPREAPALLSIPFLIPEMIRGYCEGYHVVYGPRIARTARPVDRRLPADAGDFRRVSRR